MPANNHIQKTNAVRLLEAAGVAFELVPYTVDENNLAADHVAAELGEPIEQVFKTLVLRGDRNGLFVCVMPGNMEIDLKRNIFVFLFRNRHKRLMELVLGLQ